MQLNDVMPLMAQRMLSRRRRGEEHSSISRLIQMGQYQDAPNEENTRLS
jgi:hypothetical protein